MTEKVRTWNETLTMRESYEFTDGDASVYASTRIDEFTSTVGATSSSYTYAYDSFGNIQTITDSAGLVTRYYYDDQQQLIRENNPYTNTTYVYTYDRGGNRTSRTTYTYTTGSLTNSISNTSYSYNGDRLTAIGSTAITYDEIGNPRFVGTTEFTWQNGRQLVKIESPNGALRDVYEFTYNDSGIRTSKTVNGIEHVYTLNGSQIVTESWVQNNVEYVIVYLYDESGAPIGMQYRTSNYAWGEFDNYYFEKNMFGDVVAVYNEAGNKIGSYKYDAWGVCNASVESTASTLEKKVVRTLNPFRYRGYYYDTETGFYYLQSRYYNPQWGRFLNADGYINANGDLIGFNMYAYCSNNPVMYTDPSGMCFEWLLDGLKTIVDTILDTIFPNWEFASSVGDGVDVANDVGKLANDAFSIRETHTKNIIYMVRGEYDQVKHIDALGGDQYEELARAEIPLFLSYAYGYDETDAMYKAAFTNAPLTEEEIDDIAQNYVMGWGINGTSDYFIDMFGYTTEKVGKKIWSFWSLGG